MHYRALPLARKVVEGLPEIQKNHEGVCKRCVKGTNTKKTFPSSDMIRILGGIWYKFGCMSHKSI